MRARKRAGGDGGRIHHREGRINRVMVSKNDAGSREREVVRRDLRRQVVGAQSVPHEEDHAPLGKCVRLLRASRKRPRRRAAEQRDELAPSHSITSSARASSVGGTSRARAFAVLRLITNSYFTGACTGRWAGFSPLRIRST